MGNFLQQLINGLTLGSIYGLIAIGYTMVFGIIGMVNFAHGDLFMLSAFIALLVFLVLTKILGVTSLALAFVIVLIAGMALTSVWNWTIERLAYRPLRGSFRLAPLISAIGMSIFLSNFVQVVQGPRNKPVPPMFNEVIHISPGGGYDVTLQYKQLVIGFVTAVLLFAFWWLVQKTALGRAQRACEQDRKMAALLGIDVDRDDLDHLRDRRGARRGRRRPLHDLLRRGEFLRRLPAGREGLHRGGARRHRLAARRGARRPADRPDRSVLVVLFLHRLQGRRRVHDPRHHADLHAVGHSRPT